MKKSKNLQMGDKILFITHSFIEEAIVITNTNRELKLILVEFINRYDFYDHDKYLSMNYPDYKILHPGESSKFAFSGYYYDDTYNIDDDYLIRTKEIENIGYNIEELIKLLRSPDRDIVRFTLGILNNKLKLE